MAASRDPRFALGIDFGTSHTTAILRWPDGHVRPLLFDGSPLLPSAVYAEPDGRLLAGRDALHASRLEPGRLEPTPKRRIDHASVLLGETEVPVPAMVATVLGRVRDEAVRVSGAWPREVSITLTHPATWNATRLRVLTEAADQPRQPAPPQVREPKAPAPY
jgi:molecular chaperone DnaK (HSP70)